MRFRARAAALLGCLLTGSLLLAGCAAGSDTGPADGPGSAGSAPGSSATSPSTSTAVTPGGPGDASGDPSGDPSTATSGAAPLIDPAMAVQPPGRRRDRLRSADMLIVGQRPLGPNLVQRIRELRVDGRRGVTFAAPLSVAQVTVENRTLNVAAVDPATYRVFTDAGLADARTVWDRVAGGELAITTRLGKRLQDKEAVIRLGGADAPRLHVGAYVTGFTPVIDAVVNAKWGEALKMRMGNALLVSTGSNSPASLRPRIRRILGQRASVQNLDVASRLGLDITARQTAFLTGGSVAGVVGTFNYRVLGGGRIAPEPGWVESHISTRTMPIIGSMTCNSAMFPQLEAALKEIVAQGLAGQIHPGEYAGCYYPRFIANTTTLSNHSFGLAFDINVPGNQRGTAGEIDRRVVAIFDKWGFAWGGRWRWTDPMHFEMSRIVEPR